MTSRHQTVERLIRAAIAAASDAERALREAVRLFKEQMPDYTWVGIYRLENDELILGPFLGKPSPHTRIPLGRGICGAAATERATIIVDDVNDDPRYLACSVETRSEIVVPILSDGQVLGEIDIDSDRPAAFGEADRVLLERVADMLARRLVFEAGRGHAQPAVIMKHRITLIPGDGIGPEITDAVVRILDAAGAEIEWDAQAAGTQSLAQSGTALPPALLESIRQRHVALKGPIMTPVGEGFTSVNVGLRKALELFANLRPVVNLPGVPARYQDVDLIIVRENTEDLYSGLEHEVVPGVVESLKIITEKASTRVARFAFDHARRHGRRRITAVHKANIMKLGDGLFLQSVRAVARDYSDLQYDERIVDAACMHLVLDPGRFDVMLLPNLYGDIVSDLCAGLVGGLGVVPAANMGIECAVFEAVHGSAPDIAGRNIANPTGLLLSALMMLRHLGESDRAERIRLALTRVLTSGQVLTPDMGGTATTTQFADAICRGLSGEA